mmetsp:Transcript_74850/g.243084  ORF Transcript_74850/g.243084 Transcript_74850/m.243084 type:complete len:237 (-) Transcript_74850:49-759(-)
MQELFQTRYDMENDVGQTASMESVGASARRRSMFPSLLAGERSTKKVDPQNEDGMRRRNQSVALALNTLAQDPVEQAKSKQLKPTSSCSAQAAASVAFATSLAASEVTDTPHGSKLDIQRLSMSMERLDTALQKWTQQMESQESVLGQTAGVMQQFTQTMNRVTQTGSKEESFVPMVLRPSLPAAPPKPGSAASNRQSDKGPWPLCSNPALFLPTRGDSPKARLPAGDYADLSMPS